MAINTFADARERSDDRSTTGTPQDKFALGAVPDEARTTALSIGVMLLAANISLPALVTGGQLGLARGFAGTVTASFGGGLVLAVLAGVCAYAGARSRLTTYLLIVRAFGTRGGEVINLLLSCSVVGWFGVVLMLFAETMARMAGGSSR
jgi:cytosine permease